jgi:hypothetical protein
MRRVFAFVVSVVTVSIIAAGSAPAIGASRANPSVKIAPCGPAWTFVDSPFIGATFTQLTAVSARTDSNVLAVGNEVPSTFANSRSLAEHWDGTVWSRLTIPSPGTLDGLHDVHFVADNDAWLVGTTYNGTQNDSLALRWNGSTLSRVATPNGSTGPNVGNDLTGVGGNASDLWAVGNTGTGPNFTPMILHWNGSVWSSVAVPANPGAGPYLLNAVSRVSASDAWAVGEFRNSTPGKDIPMVFHWNGAVWSNVAGVPDPGSSTTQLLSVKAFSTTDVWAVGFTTNAHRESLVLHWNGATWTRITTPTGPQDTVLNDVSGSSTNDLWAVGSDSRNNGKFVNSFALHWDGTAWTQVTSPNPDKKVNSLLGVDTVNASTNAWMVGATKKKNLTGRICPVRVTDGAITPATASAGDPATVLWSFPKGNGAAHDVTDTSGLNLFSSGPRAAGSSFSTLLVAAATYHYQDTTTGHTGTIEVPITIDPTHGGQATSYLVTFGAQSPTPPITYDVQVKGPADPAFITWLTGVPGVQGSFVPNTWQGGEGPGIYRFRSRIRNTSTQVATDWSPVAKITVT